MHAQLVFLNQIQRYLYNRRNSDDNQYKLQTINIHIQWKSYSNNRC